MPVRKKSDASCLVAPPSETAVARAGATANRRATASGAPLTTRRMKSKKGDSASRIGLSAAAAPRRWTRRSTFMDGAVLHDDLDARQRGDVEQRVAVDDDDVRELAGLDRAELAPFADDLRVDARRGGDRTAPRHAHLDVHL